MSNYHEHCWHQSNITLTSNPPQSVYVCCMCGEAKHVSQSTPDAPVGHGPYATGVFFQ